MNSTDSRTSTSPSKPPKRPWWLLPVLGPIPAVEEKHLNLLFAVSLALLFEEYDLAMLTAALPQIAATLQIPEGDFGLYLGLIRLGALPAILLIPYADRIGRRKVYLASLIGTAVTTGLTAFTQTPEQFVVCQMLTRTFFISGSAIAIVLITEEYPAEHRGWGLGMIGAIASTGHGIAMGIFSQIDILPYGWRSLYAIGALPLLLVPYFRRNIPESQRFTEQQAEGSAEAGAYSIRPLLNMLRESPGRSLGVGISGFVPAIGLVGAFQFTGYHTQTVHGWTPGEYAAMVFFGGALGIAGNIIAGRLSDRFGRRTVGMLLLGSFPFWVALFYNASGFALTIGWIGFLFVSQGGRVILRAFATELFPTDQRASAAGFWQILEALGGATGLFLIYFGSSQAGDFAVYTTGLSFCVLVGGLVLFFFPETTQRELETISR